MGWCRCLLRISELMNSVVTSVPRTARNRVEVGSVLSKTGDGDIVEELAALGDGTSGARGLSEVGLDRPGSGS